MQVHYKVGNKQQDLLQVNLACSVVPKTLQQPLALEQVEDYLEPLLAPNLYSEHKTQLPTNQLLVECLVSPLNNHHSLHRQLECSEIWVKLNNNSRHQHSVINQQILSLEIKLLLQLRSHQCSEEQDKALYLEIQQLQVEARCLIHSQLSLESHLEVFSKHHNLLLSLLLPSRNFQICNLAT